MEGLKINIWKIRKKLDKIEEEEKASFSGILRRDTGIVYLNSYIFSFYFILFYFLDNEKAYDYKVNISLISFF